MRAFSVSFFGFGSAAKETIPQGVPKGDGAVIAVAESGVRRPFLTIRRCSSLTAVSHTPTDVINKRYLSLPYRNLRLLRADLSLPPCIVHQPAV